MYTKIIQSGTQIEVWNYEKEPIPITRRRKKRRYSYGRRYTRNVHRARSSFFRLVRANVSPESRPALLTLTMREIVSIGEGWKAFTYFANRLRKARPEIAFVAVPEFQKRGAVHFHCLIWGFYDEEIARERDTRRIAELWGHGFIDIRATDGSPKLATYIAKYMFKAMWDERLLGKKSFSASRNLVRSVSVKNQASVAIIEAQIQGTRFGLAGEILEGVDKPLLPLQEREYMTKWLGKCDYKVYNYDESV